MWDVEYPMRMPKKLGRSCISSHQLGRWFWDAWWTHYPLCSACLRVNCIYIYIYTYIYIYIYTFISLGPSKNPHFLSFWGPRALSTRFSAPKHHPGRSSTFWGLLEAHIMTKNQPMRVFPQALVYLQSNQIIPYSNGCTPKHENCPGGIMIHLRAEPCPHPI